MNRAPHTWPLKDRLGDDGEGDDRAKLQARDRDDRNRCVLQRIAKVHRAIGQPPCPGGLHVVRAQGLKHLGAHQPHDQCRLVQTQRDRR